ncbi:hypothetical protein ACI2KO_00460 [Pseudomonas piscis]|uniref:Uncharacterized protein n=1 Tax=Pseudomonas piscis TaxID=2614538 RepID=A0ABY9NPF9_9PSED|nr:hypothetical protein [Pseudomonas piscis]WMN20434.1 hypothetical protein QL104_13885 [Pseudomonas piscis]
MNNHHVPLANGWTARFTYRGEFRMGAEGWSLLLEGPGQQRIGYFDSQIVLVNDEDGAQARSCISLSEDGTQGYLAMGPDHGWVLDFARSMLAPHRVNIHHHHPGYDESVSVCEQPTFKRERQYIRVIGKFIYLTFPLTRDEDFPKVWEEYLAIRRRQLDELYFRN